MDWLFVMVAALVVLYIIVRAITSSAEHKYKRSGPLLTPSERSFFVALEQATPSQYRVMSKVRVADVITPSSHKQSAFNRIAAQHFDFVICDKASLNVVAVVELKDASHQRSRVKKRDGVLNAACQSAKVPLVRFRAQNAYQPDSIRADLSHIIQPDVDEIATQSKQAIDERTIAW